MSHADRGDLPASPVGVPLRPYQQRDYEFLREHPRAAVWDEAGLGKTRPLLAASEGRVLVIAPASVRDTEVWPLEASRIGVEPPQVISYHEAAKYGTELLDIPRDTLILDESHNAKERKTSWTEPIHLLTQRTERVYQATGTPMPNNALELWSQLRMIRPQTREMRYYWPWVREWFELTSNRYSKFAPTGDLLGCRCRQPEDVDTACRHWQAFYEGNLAGYVIRHLRDDVMTDLPPLSGADTPLWTPMTPKQSRLYAQMAKDMIASIPEQGIMFEALTDTHQFHMLHLLSSGLSVLDPDADPRERESGKLALTRDLLAARRRPTVVACWFKPSALAIVRMCERLGLSYVTMGSKTTRPQRREAVRQFGAGGVDVLIGSIGVIREGVDGLQYASDETILFERSWVPGWNEQLIRRLHRLGQDRPVTARQLVTPKSVDETQWNDVAAKDLGVRRALSPVEVATLLDAS